MPLKLRFHSENLSVCRIDPKAPVPAGILQNNFAVFLRTQGEATLICPSGLTPKGAETESGWIALELVGPFAFSQTGILTQVTQPLAEAGIPIFAFSTFSTDYVLIKIDKQDGAKAALEKAGHIFL